MHEYTLENGVKIHLSEKDIAAIAAMGSGGGNSAYYRNKTEELAKHAANELREMTGDHPESLEEMFEFAVKHELFGKSRTVTHLMCNFLKLLFAMLQKETHS